MESKRMDLTHAVRKWVRPSMHLNFASVPSRSNASVRAVAQVFAESDPGFVLSSTGFHSALHLLAMLRLGRRYIACFFGDNYPVPRPNDLYAALEAEGAAIEIWSLWSYVSALRAGALGHPEAVTRSLVGTSMGGDLEALGRLSLRDEQDGTRAAHLAPLRPDITFVHGVMADELGNVVFSPPASEGFWGANGATVGIIATVERIVPRQELHPFGDAMRIPPHRILAIAECPQGAHPQSLYAAPRFGPFGYMDDYDEYVRWRERAAQSVDRAASRRIARDFLSGEQGYREVIGEARFEQLHSSALALRHHAMERGARRTGSPSSRPPSFIPPASRENETKDAARSNEIMLVLAARAIVERVREKGYPIVLAGIGHAFLAARMAKLWLDEQGVDVKVMVETGLFDLECGPVADEFLLSYANVALAERHSSVEDILGTITCGADSVCLGVLGAAQVDPLGRINSTRVRGKLLVGSGGANDIASTSAEVVVLSRAAPSRLVAEVEYVTSPGHRVLTVATDLCTLRRDRAEERWSVRDLYPALGGRPPEEVLGVLARQCGWPSASLLFADSPEYGPVISTHEMATLHRLDPDGVHWRREK